MKFKQFIYLFLFVFLNRFVSSAQTSSSTGALQGIKESFSTFFGALLSILFVSEADPSGLLLIEKFLFFVITYLLIFLILGRIELFQENKAIKIVVALAVSILATRFMPFSWLDTLMGEYQALSMIMAYLLICSPILLFFYVLHWHLIDSSLLRRFAWILFISIYISLWITAENVSHGAIFFWVMIAAVLMMFFDLKLHKIVREYKNQVGEAKNNTSSTKK